MTQYNTINLSNSQVNKLNSRIKNGAEVTFILSSNVIGNFNDETIFPHELLLTNTQFSRLHKTFPSSSSVNIK